MRAKIEFICSQQLHLNVIAATCFLFLSCHSIVVVAVRTNKRDVIRFAIVLSLAAAVGITICLFIEDVKADNNQLTLMTINGFAFVHCS